MTFPHFDPVLIHLGPFAIRWYALAYIAGILLGWRYGVALIRNARIWPPAASPITVAQMDDLILWITLGAAALGLASLAVIPIVILLLLGWAATGMRALRALRGSDRRVRFLDATAPATRGGRAGPARNRGGRWGVGSRDDALLQLQKSYS